MDALKGILVCSFGYLSYRNAKFGLIDCHISVCAYARQILLETARIAEIEGLRGRPRDSRLPLGQEKRGDTGGLRGPLRGGTGPHRAPDGFRGHLPVDRVPPEQDARGRAGAQPLLRDIRGRVDEGEGHRAEEEGSIKVVTDCQEELLQLLSQGKDLGEARGLMPEAIQTVGRYVERVRSGDVSSVDLMILNALSKNHDQYDSNLVQVSAIRQLADEGLELMAGQSVSYVITNYRSKTQSDRVKPVELLDADTKYDKERYIELLIKGAASVLQPFGVDELVLKERLVNPHEQQAQLFQR